MSFQHFIQQLIDKKDLSESQMIEAMNCIMQGQASPAQMAGFLIALCMKGETVTELSAAARVMRQLAKPVEIVAKHVVDMVGTGGDQAHTFNISTACVFVVGAAGGIVAKHGGRSVSSKSGAADVLEAAGVNIKLTPEQISQCIHEIGVGFMFAPNHHLAMSHVMAPRKELGVRTLFNLLGPLTNPAKAPHSLIGVYHKKWLQPFAKVLKTQGSKHALIVHGEDGLDEISIAADTHIAELKNNKISTYIINPQQFGFKPQSLDDLRVTNAKESLTIIKEVFANKAGPARDIVILNAGAAIYAADLCESLADGIEKAQTAITKGLAKNKLQALIDFTNKYK